MNRLVLAILLAPWSAAGANPEDYALVIPIETPGESAAWQLSLDGSFAQVSLDPDFRDLAVFNADGQRVPIKIYPADFVDQDDQPSATGMHVSKPADTEQLRSQNVPVLPVPNNDQAGHSDDLQLIVQRDATGRLRSVEASTANASERELKTREWWIDLKGLDGGIQSLELDWDGPRQDVVARFEVSDSRDLQNWSIRNSGAAVVQLEKDGARIDQRSIKVVALERYLRLRRIDDGPALTGLNARATGINRKRLLTSASWIEAVPVERIGDLTASETLHLYEIGGWSPGISVRASSVWITLENENSVAQLDVFTLPAGSNGKQHWTHRARVDAFRLQQGDETINNPDTLLSLPARVPRVRNIRIDSATPLASHPTVVAGYRPERLLFLAEGRAPFVLAMGNATEKYPDYPVEAALRSLRSRLGQDWQPPTAGLNEVQAVYREGQGVPTDSGIPWKRWLLWGVLILAATVVGVLSLGLLRASQRSAEDGQQPPEK